MSNPVSSLPLLVLVCAACGAEMPLPGPRGLLIGNGEVTIQSGKHKCTACGHVHQVGEVLSFRVSGAG